MFGPGESSCIFPWRRRTRYGSRSSWFSPHDAANSSRAPSVARGDPALAAQYSLNAKTVAKWRKRTATTDQPMGPNRPLSTVLTEAEEATIVEFRRRTLLPFDDVLVD